MSSPSKSAKPSPFSAELIEKEIAHLKKGRSTRQAQEARRGRMGGSFFLILAVLFGLYALDPILFSYDRGDAIRVYLYLHNYGNDRQAQAVGVCGLLLPGEVRELNRRAGFFQDYFNGTEAAEKKGDQLIRYMNGVRALHENRYDELTPLNKLRYFLFIKTGLTPPIRWDFLNSSVSK